MTRQQTRRSVSVKGLTYQRIEAYVATTGGTISGFVEDTIVSNLGSPTEEDRRKFDEESAKKASVLERTPVRESEPTQVDQDRRKLDEGIAKEQVSIKTSRSKPTPIAPRVETPNSEIPDELKDYIPPNLLL
jgi:hypothetical protein